MSVPGSFQTTRNRTPHDQPARLNAKTDPASAPTLTPRVCQSAERKGGRWKRHHEVLIQIQTTIATYPPQIKAPYPVIQTRRKNVLKTDAPARYSFQRDGSWSVSHRWKKGDRSSRASKAA